MVTADERIKLIVYIVLVYLYLPDMYDEKLGSYVVLHAGVYNLFGPSASIVSFSALFCQSASSPT